MPADTVLADTFLANTGAISALGGAYTAQAADLAAISSALRSLPSPTALGPIGERFLAALTDAVNDISAAVATLSDDVASAGATAGHTATSYDLAGTRAAHLLPQV
jgi:hypothetical protein